jgi:hypothetical protein
MCSFFPTEPKKVSPPIVPVVPPTGTHYRNRSQQVMAMVVTLQSNCVKIYLQLPSSSLSSCKYHYEMIYHQNKKKRLAKLLT